MILALDLASVTGWACGAVGEHPSHGYIRFAKPGASHEAIFANAAKWAESMIDQYKPTLVIWESPLSTAFKRGVTTTDTTAILFGLPAVIGSVAYRRGIYDLRKAATRDVRLHFIGSNPKRVAAKKLVIKACNVRGWNVTDDNEADALSLWDFMQTIQKARAA